MAQRLDTKRRRASLLGTRSGPAALRPHRLIHRAGPAQPVRDTELEPDPAQLDPGALRAREAGGPSDLAFYSCSCGYLFQAPVSTSVSCPHCQAPQAW